VYKLSETGNDRAGCESDTETSLYYYRARYYDPNAGRFVSEDPIGFDGEINFYAYVENDPPNLIDPSGLDSVTIGPITIPLPWTRCTKDAWYCTNVMTPTQIRAEDAHEADHRLRWRDRVPPWFKEKLGFAAELQILRKRKAELLAKKCLTDDEKRDLDGVQQMLDQAEPIADWNDDHAAKFYWNENVRRWWQKRVPY
jgi:RHS repeat-associated protein